MPWVRFDDQFPIHRKAAGLSDAAFRLHVSAIFWCARNLTDGFVPEEDLDDVCARVRTPARFAAECVRRGAWHEAGHSCPSARCPGPVDGSGWVIHDYWDYQPSKDQVVRDRQASARRQANWRARRNGVSNAPSNGVDNGYPAPPRNKRGGGRPESVNGRASPPGSPVPATKPPWCGKCNETSRLRERDDGTVFRCPACHPLAQETAHD